MSQQTSLSHQHAGMPIGMDQLNEIDSLLQIEKGGTSYSRIVEWCVAEAKKNGFSLTTEELSVIVSKDLMTMQGVLLLTKEGQVYSLHINYSYNNPNTFKWYWGIQNQGALLTIANNPKVDDPFISPMSAMFAAFPEASNALKAALELLKSIPLEEEQVWQILYEIGYQKAVIPSSNVYAVVKAWSKGLDFSLFGLYKSLFFVLDKKEASPKERALRALAKCKAFTDPAKLGLQPRYQILYNDREEDIKEGAEEDIDSKYEEDEDEDEGEDEDEDQDEGEGIEDEDLAIAARYS